LPTKLVRQTEVHLHKIKNPNFFAVSQLKYLSRKKMLDEKNNCYSSKKIIAENHLQVYFSSNICWMPFNRLFFVQTFAGRKITVYISSSICWAKNHCLYFIQHLLGEKSLFIFSSSICWARNHRLYVVQQFLDSI
jgi:uncharacterized Fe-S cluster protein YjdI